MLTSYLNALPQLSCFPGKNKTIGVLTHEIQRNYQVRNITPWLSW